MIASNNRYYVQRLTEQIFLVRERLVAGRASGPADRIVRSFAFRDDACKYIDSLNEKQRGPDEHDGYGTQQEDAT
jgi:sensor domain CHASE-containing protein